MLLERTDQLSALADALAAVTVARAGAVVFVGGEAGAGKTVLLRAFCDQRHDSARILWGACDGLLTPGPLGPLFDVAEVTGGELEELVSREARPHEVTGALIRALAGRRPTVLVLEDLHWADEATLDVLRLLARKVEGVSTLALASYRDDELDRAHPLTLVLGELATTRAVTRFAIPPLSEQAVGELAAPHEIDAGELHRQTSGNAFYVTEVLAAATGEIPHTVRDAVLARLARLSAPPTSVTSTRRRRTRSRPPPGMPGRSRWASSSTTLRCSRTRSPTSARSRSSPTPRRRRRSSNAAWSSHCQPGWRSRRAAPTSTSCGGRCACAAMTSSIATSTPASSTAPSAAWTCGGSSSSPAGPAWSSTAGCGARRPTPPPRRCATVARGRCRACSPSRCSRWCAPGAAIPTCGPRSTRRSHWPSRPASYSAWAWSPPRVRRPRGWKGDRRTSWGRPRLRSASPCAAVRRGSSASSPAGAAAPGSRRRSRMASRLRMRPS